jgi:hypothetical protein
MQDFILRRHHNVGLNELFLLQLINHRHFLILRRLILHKSRLSVYWILFFTWMLILHILILFAIEILPLLLILNFYLNILAIFLGNAPVILILVSDCMLVQVLTFFLAANATHLSTRIFEMLLVRVVHYERANLLYVLLQVLFLLDDKG